MEVDELFAYLTHEDGTNFQVLIRDENNVAIGVDDAATHAAYNQYALEKAQGAA